ncbi:MAG: hypothetical protein M1365_02635 [Actinobacteria bacterium]|nr:hypothetical protein [Actinomycetota bacterium]
MLYAIYKAKIETYIAEKIRNGEWDMNDSDSIEDKKEDNTLKTHNQLVLKRKGLKKSIKQRARSEIVDYFGVNLNSVATGGIFFFMVV